MGFSRQEYWSGLPFPSPGDLPDPGIKPRSPALQADSLTSEPPGKWRKDKVKRPLYSEIVRNCQVKLAGIGPCFQRSVQSLGCDCLCTPWIAECHASLFFTNSQSLLKLMSIESVMPYNHLQLPAFNLSQHQDLFQGVSSLHQVAKLLELQLQHQSFQWIFRNDFL